MATVLRAWRSSTAQASDRSRPGMAPQRPAGADTGPPAAAHPWLDRWLAANADLADLHASNPQVDAVIEEIDGRRIRIGDRWLIDFASCNYLGFDLDREIIEAIPAYLDRWGTHPSWSRMIGSPVLYEQLEQELVELLGAGDVLLLQTLTHIHASVIPVLAGDGTIFVDARAHKTIWDGCVVARAHGATLRRFRHDDPDDLERLLAAERGHPRLICMDGINSMTGNPPDLAALGELARRYEALLYVDDGHGFGVVGERSPDEPSPYGRRGNGVVRHLGQSYDHLVLTGGFSKAYSSMLAFIACPPRMKELLKIAAPPYLYSGPSPVASLATGLEGLKVNARRGDALRASLYTKTRRILDCLDRKGVMTLNSSGFPIVEVPLADPDDLGKVGAIMYERGIYVTLAFYPGVPREEVGFRLQITAANTDEEVAELVGVLEELALDGRLRLRE
jgi:8-amino-7-oxononanoate synthase